MQIPVEISFDGFEPSDFVRARVAKEAKKLETFHDRITRCRVVVAAPGHHHAKGGLFAVHVHLTVPGHKEVVVSREPQQHKAHADPYVAIRDAFAAARRAMQDVDRKLAETTVVTHSIERKGRVARLLYEAGYGFIDSPDGSGVFFHSSAVAPGEFERLAIGTPVRFVVGEEGEGPKASFVAIAHD